MALRVDSARVSAQGRGACAFQFNLKTICSQLNHYSCRSFLRLCPSLGFFCFLLLLIVIQFNSIQVMMIAEAAEEPIMILLLLLLK